MSPHELVWAAVGTAAQRCVLVKEKKKNKKREMAKEGAATEHHTEENEGGAGGIANELPELRPPTGTNERI